MIRFDKIEQTKEKTYFFFSNHYRRDLVWCLKECGITDYEIVLAGKDHMYQGKLPVNVTVKPVFIKGKTPEPIKFPPVLISNMDIKGLEKAMEQLYFGHDEDLWEHKMQLSEHGLAHYNERWDVFETKVDE